MNKQKKSGRNSKASKGLTSDHSAADRIKLTESNFSCSNGRVISQESRQRAAAAYWAESAPLFVCTLRFMNQLIVTVRRQHKADSTNEEKKKNENENKKKKKKVWRGLGRDPRNRPLVSQGCSSCWPSSSLPEPLAAKCSSTFTSALPEGFVGGGVECRPASVPMLTVMLV